jgi:glutaredoxin
MEEVKQQKIAVLLSLTETDKNLIMCGIRIANIFSKELCLCYNLSKKEKDRKDELKEKLNSYINPIKNELPGIEISTLLTSGKLTYLPEKLADDYEVILMIAAASEFSKYAKSLSESSVPFLFINENEEQLSRFKKLILPVDLRKENSDSVLWCSYFGRFNSSKIIVVAANDKGKSEQKQVMVNVALAKKLFLKLKIDHKIFRGIKSSLNNSFEALDLAITSESDLLVILGSSAITPIDLLIGLPEKKIVKRAGKLPVLIINTKKDNYILCD